RALASVHGQEEHRFAFPPRTEASSEVALGRFDLHDLGTEVGQHHPGVRGGDEVPDLHDPDPGEGEGPGFLRRRVGRPLARIACCRHRSPIVGRASPLPSFWYQTGSEKGSRMSIVVGYIDTPE